MKTTFVPSIIILEIFRVQISQKKSSKSPSLLKLGLYFFGLDRKIAEIEKYLDYYVTGSRLKITAVFP